MVSHTQGSPVTTDQNEHSQLIKPHTGLAAAISRILCGDQIALKSEVDRTKQKSTVSLSKPDSHTRSLPKKKRRRVNSDSEEDSSDEKALHQQIEVVKVCHRLPHNFSVEDERKLQRLATRGVVQLFNAVSKHQKSLEEKLKEVGPSERKKHKVLSSVDKGGFIDMLKGNETTKMAKKSSPESTEPAWSILRDDYMKNSKMQDWDKDDEDNSDHDSDISSDE